MRTLTSVSIVILLFFTTAASAFAIGEKFKVETTGTEYCGDSNFHKFNASNNVDLWAEIVSETEITVSSTPDFAPGTTFPMYGTTYVTGITSSGTKAAFVGGVLFDNYTYATVQAKMLIDKYGTVKSMTGTFIQSGVTKVNCFSSGTLKTLALSPSAGPNLTPYEITVAKNACTYGADDSPLYTTETYYVAWEIVNSGTAQSTYQAPMTVSLDGQVLATNHVGLLPVHGTARCCLCATIGAGTSAPLSVGTHILAVSVDSGKNDGTTTTLQKTITVQ